MEITRADFDQLTVNSTNWQEYRDGWISQEGRFEDINYSLKKTPIDYNFARAYWVQDYSSVMFVKAYLYALDFTYRVYYDTADDSYMITTNYGGAL
jgi:hypothetical protein